MFARGGSKGIPDKNLREIGGVPLIGHAVRCGLACEALESIIVSTDDQLIAEKALQYGAKVPFLRPAYLAADDTPEREAWRHAVREVEHTFGAFDLFVSIPPTAPLRSVQDLQAVIDRFDSSNTDLVISVTEAKRSPYFNMVQTDSNGLARLVIPPEETVSRRQEAPRVYDMTTVAYACTPEYVKSNTPLMECRVRVVEIPAERAIDIDEPLDLEIAKFLWRRAHGG